MTYDLMINDIRGRVTVRLQSRYDNNKGHYSYVDITYTIHVQIIHFYLFFVLTIW